jgi:hypothetical protein
MPDLKDLLNLTTYISLRKTELSIWRVQHNVFRPFSFIHSWSGDDSVLFLQEYMRLA